MSLFDRIKNLWNKIYANKIVHFLLCKWVVAAIVFLVVVIFTNNNNFGVWFRTQSQIRQQERQIDSLRKATDLNYEKLHRLQSSKDSLEKFAREQYNFVEDGEDLYIVK